MELNIHVTATAAKIQPPKNKTANERHQNFRSRHSGRNGANNKKGSLQPKENNSKAGFKRKEGGQQNRVKKDDGRQESNKTNGDAENVEKTSIAGSQTTKGRKSVFIKSTAPQGRDKPMPKSNDDNNDDKPVKQDISNVSTAVHVKLQRDNKSSSSNANPGKGSNTTSKEKPSTIARYDETNKVNGTMNQKAKTNGKTSITSTNVAIGMNEEEKKKKIDTVVQQVTTEAAGQNTSNQATKEKNNEESSQLNKIDKSSGGSRKRPVREHVDYFESEHHMSVSRLSQNAHAKPTKSKSSEHIFVKNKDFSSSLNIHEKLIGILKLSKEQGGFGLEHPTYVQRIAVNSLSEGKSAFIKSQTGSGKTLAFLLPVVHRLVNIEPKPSRNDGTLALIIAPTRELCSQIYEVLVLLLKPFIWLVPGLITGGERKKSEKGRIRKGISCLVATPGRLLDHLQSTESFKINNLKAFILDEVDRLLDMGFDKQIKDIMKLLLNPKVVGNGGVTGDHGSLEEGSSKMAGLNALTHKSEVQTILSSATTTNSVQALLKEYVHHYEYFDADEASGSIDGDGLSCNKKAKIDGEGEKAFSTTYDIPKQLSQHSMVVTYKLRLPALCAILKYCYDKQVKVVVFVSTTSAADFLDSLFKKALWPSQQAASAATTSSKQDVIDASDKSSFFQSWPCFRLHGDVPQKERTSTIKKFHQLKSGVMICTDVASRGLDMPHIDWIIQYDPPCEISDYVHRIGRTARKGQHGSSLIFLSPNEQAFLDILFSKNLTIKPLSLEASFERAFESKNTPQSHTQTHASSTAAGGGDVPPSFVNSKITPISLQEYLEMFVDQNEELKVMASSAYQSFVRAYPIHASEIKQCFQIRALHLGHVARSFALRHAPTDIKKMASKKKAAKNSFEKKEKDSVEAAIAVKREANENKGGATKKKARSSETFTDI